MAHLEPTQPRNWDRNEHVSSIPFPKLSPKLQPKLDFTPRSSSRTATELLASMETNMETSTPSSSDPEDVLHQYANSLPQAVYDAFCSLLDENDSLRTKLGMPTRSSNSGTDPDHVRNQDFYAHVHDLAEDMEREIHAARNQALPSLQRASKLYNALTVTNLELLSHFERMSFLSALEAYEILEQSVVAHLMISDTNDAHDANAHTIPIPLATRLRLAIRLPLEAARIEQLARDLRETVQARTHDHHHDPSSYDAPNQMFSYSPFVLPTELPDAYGNNGTSNGNGLPTPVSTQSTSVTPAAGDSYLDLDQDEDQDEDLRELYNEPDEFAFDECFDPFAAPDFASSFYAADPYPIVTVAHSGSHSVQLEQPIPRRPISLPLLPLLPSLLYALEEDSNDVKADHDHESKDDYEHYEPLESVLEPIDSVLTHPHPAYAYLNGHRFGSILDRLCEAPEVVAAMESGRNSSGAISELELEFNVSNRSRNSLGLSVSASASSSVFSKRTDYSVDSLPTPFLHQRMKHDLGHIYMSKKETGAVPEPLVSRFSYSTDGVECGGSSDGECSDGCSNEGLDEHGGSDGTRSDMDLELDPLLDQDEDEDDGASISSIAHSDRPAEYTLKWLLSIRCTALQLDVENYDLGSDDEAAEPEPELTPRMQYISYPASSTSLSSTYRWNRRAQKLACRYQSLADAHSEVGIGHMEHGNDELVLFDPRSLRGLPSDRLYTPIPELKRVTALDTTDSPDTADTDTRLYSSAERDLCNEANVTSASGSRSRSAIASVSWFPAAQRSRSHSISFDDMFDSVRGLCRRDRSLHMSAGEAQRRLGLELPRL